MGEIGRIKVITGGSRGIGRAVALKFIQDKGKIIIVHYDPDESAAEETLDMLGQQGLEAESHKVDVSSYEDVEVLFQDILRRHRRS